MTSHSLDPLMAALDQVSLLQHPDTPEGPAAVSLAQRVQDLSAALGNPISAALAHQAIARIQTPAAAPAAETRFAWDRPVSYESWQAEQAAVDAAVVEQGEQATRAGNQAFHWRLAAILPGSIVVGLSVSYVLIQGITWASGLGLAGVLALVGFGMRRGDRKAKAAVAHAANQQRLRDRRQALKEDTDITLSSVQRWAKLPHAVPELYAILTSGVPFLKGDVDRFQARQEVENHRQWRETAQAERADTYRTLQAFVEDQMKTGA